MSQESTTDPLTTGQRIAVRWPGLMHLTTTSVLRLPKKTLSEAVKSIVESEAVGLKE